MRATRGQKPQASSPGRPADFRPIKLITFAGNFPLGQAGGHVAFARLPAELEPARNTWAARPTAKVRPVGVSGPVGAVAAPLRPDGVTSRRGAENINNNRRGVFILLSLAASRALPS